MTEYIVPIGWTKGDRLRITLDTCGHKKTWRARQDLSNLSMETKIIAPDHVAHIIFYSEEEVNDFIQWWKTDD